MDTIVAVGGDGTANAVLNAIAGRDTALGIIPAGTANDLASFYRTPTDVHGACDAILERRVRRADLIGVNGRYYVTAGGLGLPSKVAEVANTIKRGGIIGKGLQQLLGGKLYGLSAAYALLKERSPRDRLDIQWDASSLTADAVALMISNQPFVGGDFLITPAAINDDGRFDICLVETPKCRAQIPLAIFKALTGRHVDLPFVKTWRATQLIIKAEKPVTFFGDGEVFQKATEFRIKIFPGALNVISAENAPGERDRCGIIAGRE